MASPTIKDFANLSLGRRKLIVGIDFGTTYSGVAWAETRRPDQQFVIESWPATISTKEGYSSPKVPTELRYVSDGTEWGAQIPAGLDRQNWFKLALNDHRNKLSSGPKAPHPDIKSFPPVDRDRGPDELTSDYLREVYKHVMYTLEQKVGSKILQNMPIDFVLTVPAIWTEKAKDRTLKACEKAGIKSDSPILLVSEPEAAAIYTLHGMSPEAFAVGDTFIVCDAGGGTVDLISYTVTQISPTLKVKEAAAGDGACCGSIFLNRKFADYLSSELSGEPGWDKEILADALDRFENVIKKQYSTSTSANETYTIMVPGLPNNESLGVRRGRYFMKAKAIKAIFEPVMNQIIELVKKQIRTTNKTCKAVLLVGGFGQNTYLKERLRSSLERNIEIMQPPNAWTAVVRGSVMMGLRRADRRCNHIEVESRVARKAYGIRLSTKFIKAKHDPTEKYWHEAECEDRIKVMSWFIKAGDTVRENRPYAILFSQKFPVTESLPSQYNLTVYEYESAPHDSTSLPLYKDSRITDAVKLKADLSQLPKSVFKKYTSPSGIKYLKAKGSIEATYSSASTKFMLRMAGKRYDAVTVERV